MKTNWIAATLRTTIRIKNKTNRNQCSKIILYELCAFPVRICIPGKDVHSQWGKSLSRWGYAFHVRHIPIPSEDMHSRWGTFSFPVKMFIPLWFILTGNAYPHRQWGCLTGNAYPHQEWGCVSLGMHILTGNADPHWEWGCTSPGMGMCLTGNGDVPHGECVSSPGMHIITRNAHSLQRVKMVIYQAEKMWLDLFLCCVSCVYDYKCMKVVPKGNCWFHESSFKGFPVF